MVAGSWGRVGNGLGKDKEKTFGGVMKISYILIVMRLTQV